MRNKQQSNFRLSPDTIAALRKLAALRAFRSGKVVSQADVIESLVKAEAKREGIEA